MTNYRERREKKNILVLNENKYVLQEGFLKKGKPLTTVEERKEHKKEVSSVAEKTSAALDPTRTMKQKITDILADLMPDIAQALGIEVDEDVPLTSLLGSDDAKID